MCVCIMSLPCSVQFADARKESWLIDDDLLICSFITEMKSIQF